MMEKQFYRVQEAAYILNCSSGTVYKFIKEGRLAYTTCGKAYLITRDSIERLIENSIRYNKPE